MLPARKLQGVPCYDGFSKDVRRSVVGTRAEDGVLPFLDMPDIRDWNRGIPVSRARFESNSGSLLARLWAYHRHSVFAESTIYGMGVVSKYQGLGTFTIFAGCWSFGWLVYLVCYDIQIRSVWSAFYFRLGMLFRVFDFEYRDYGDGISKLTEAWGTGGATMNELIRLLSESGNWGAAAFGFLGMIISGVLGFFLKRPIVQQAVENERFKAIRDGFEALTISQGNRIVYLESQMSIRDQYVDELLHRLRECEERHLRRENWEEE